MAAYTGTPRTWAAAEKITYTLLNAEVRDPLAALSGAWTAYTPTLGGFTAGSGSITGAYLRVGKLIAFRAQWTYGSGSAAASAYPTLSLPVTAATTVGNLLNGSFLDSGTASYMAFALLSSTSVVQLAIPGTNGVQAQPSTTSPFTWTTGDSIRVAGIYEAA